MRTGMKILSKTFQKTMSHFDGRKKNFLPLLLLDGWLEHQSHIKTFFPKWDLGKLQTKRLWTTTIALTTLLNIPKIKVFAHRFNILNCSVFFFSPTCIKTFNLKEYWSYGIIREKYRGKTPKWKQWYENKEILISTYL